MPRLSFDLGCVLCFVSCIVTGDATEGRAHGTQNTTSAAFPEAKKLVKIAKETET